MKKKSAHTGSSPDGPLHVAAIESDVFTKLGGLVAHCAELRYDDGTSRKPGWFTVKTLGAAWVVQVKDPDSACGLTLTAQTLDDALALADLMVSADDAPWEPDPWLKRQAASQKKKS